MGELSKSSKKDTFSTFSDRIKLFKNIMKYKEFHIVNFRGIADQKINLSDSSKSNIFTLVGLNESGKTTVLEAINFFAKDQPKDQEYTVIPRRELSGFTGEVYVEALISLDQEDTEEMVAVSKANGFILDEKIPMGEVRMRKTYKFTNSQFVPSASNRVIYPANITAKGTLKGKKKITSLTANPVPWQAVINHLFASLPQIIHYPNFLSRFPKRIYLEAKSGELSDQAFYRNVIQDILDSMDKGFTLADHIVARVKSTEKQQKASLDQILSNLSAQMTKSVFSQWNELFSSKGKSIVLNVDLDEEGVPYLEIKLKQEADIFDITERSLGFTWFFSFLLFIEFRKYRTKDKGETLFLLDEPASNLHSTAQNNLLKTFEKITDRSKLIYTTHSHHLINSEWLEGAFIVKNNAVDYDQESLDFDASKTDVEIIEYKTFASNHPDQSSYFQPILDTLEYKPSNLEMVDSLVIVEGKNDYYTFSYILKYIFNEKEREKLTFSLYPGNGAGCNDKVMRLYTAWSKEFLVLTDADLAGVNAKKKYESEIGISVKNKVFNLQDVDPTFKGFSTEDLFDEIDKMSIIQKVFPGKKYSKANFNESVQFLVATKDLVTLSEKTLDNFRKVNTFLEQKFTENKK